MPGITPFTQITYSVIATVAFLLASVYNHLGEYNQAKELHEKALTIRKKIFGEDHADVATSYSNLASVYKQPGRIQSSQRTLRKSSDDWETNFR